MIRTHKETARGGSPASAVKFFFSPRLLGHSGEIEVGPGVVFLDRRERSNHMVASKVPVRPTTEFIGRPSAARATGADNTVTRPRLLSSCRWSTTSAIDPQAASSSLTNKSDLR